MASNIDFSVPVFGTPTTDSVRDQFHTAYIEITELQDRIAASRPAGAVNQIQYNAGGFSHPAFGASAQLTWDAGYLALTNATATSFLILTAEQLPSARISTITNPLEIQSSQMNLNASGGPFVVGTSLAGPATERMRITMLGEVGIGNFSLTPPAFKLDIQGDCNLSTGSHYRINGVPIALDHLDHDLPLTDPGPGSKRLWCDPADGHRVKFAV